MNENKRHRCFVCRFVLVCLKPKRERQIMYIEISKGSMTPVLCPIGGVQLKGKCLRNIFYFFLLPSDGDHNGDGRYVEKTKYHIYMQIYPKSYNVDDIL